MVPMDSIISINGTKDRGGAPRRGLISREQDVSAKGLFDYYRVCVCVCVCVCFAECLF